jgi:hypothetical protein
VLALCGEYLAPLLMVIALWRSRAVLRWLAALFFVSLEVAQQMSSSGPVVVLYMLPFAVAMVLLAIRLWQAATSADSQGRTLQPPGMLAAASLLATAPSSISPLSAWASRRWCRSPWNAACGTGGWPRWQAYAASLQPL